MRNHNFRKVLSARDEFVFGNLAPSQSRVKDYLLALGPLANRFGELVDVSAESSDDAWQGATMSIALGVSDFLNLGYVNHHLVEDEDLPFLKTAAGVLQLALEKDQAYQLPENAPDRPSRNRDGYDGKDIVTLYAYILDHFLWEGGHSTEVTSSELAVHRTLQWRIAHQKQSVLDKLTSVF
jgi:hypothetical protein